MRKILFFIGFGCLVAESALAAAGGFDGGEAETTASKLVVTAKEIDVQEAKGMLAELNTAITKLQTEESGTFNPRILEIAKKARIWRGVESSNENLWRIAHRISSKMVTYAANAACYIPIDQHHLIRQIGSVLGRPEGRGPADLDQDRLMASLRMAPDEESKEDA